MNASLYKAIRGNPKFQELVHRRGRFAWTLASVVLATFYGFVLVVAFMPDLLGLPLLEGSRVTYGYLLVLFMFVFFWILTALYVRRANREFDTLSQEAVDSALRESV